MSGVLGLSIVKRRWLLGLRLSQLGLEFRRLRCFERCLFCFAAWRDLDLSLRLP